MEEDRNKILSDIHYELSGIHNMLEGISHRIMFIAIIAFVALLEYVGLMGEWPF